MARGIPHGSVRVAPLPLSLNREKIDFVYLIATMPGRHSGDQVHKDKKNAAPPFLTYCPSRYHGPSGRVVVQFSAWNATQHPQPRNETQYLLPRVLQVSTWPAHGQHMVSTWPAHGQHTASTRNPVPPPSRPTVTRPFIFPPLFEQWGKNRRCCATRHYTGGMHRR